MGACRWEEGANVRRQTSSPQDVPVMNAWIKKRKDWCRVIAEIVRFSPSYFPTLLGYNENSCYVYICLLFVRVEFKTFFRPFLNFFLIIVSRILVHSSLAIFSSIDRDTCLQISTKQLAPCLFAMGQKFASKYEHFDQRIAVRLLFESLFISWPASLLTMLDIFFMNKS